MPAWRAFWRASRRALFWAHLASGLVAGLFIVVMSATGIVVAFEEEILDLIDRDQRVVVAPEGAERLPIDALLAKARAEHVGFEGGALDVPGRPDEVLELSVRGRGSLYIDPYTGEAATPASARAHDLLHAFLDVHRFLGLEGEARPIGAFIHGSANLALVFLCVSGLVLWFPRTWRWSWKRLRPLLVLVKTKGPKARDFNLHNVFGFWSSAALLVVTATALPISFGWAHAAVFRAVGEEAPAERGFGMMRVPEEAVAPAAPGEARLSLEEIHARLAAAYPGHDAVVFYFSPHDDPEAPAPLDIHVLMPDLFATRGRVMTQVDPYRGSILSSVAFADRSPGIRARVWARFLHSGEALGLAGKLIATLASAAAIVLVITGLMLSLRRYRKWRT